MDVYSFKGDTLYEMHFKKGEPVSELTVSQLAKKQKRTGTLTRWRPDLDVFTDTKIPKEYFGKACDLGYQKGCDSYRKLNEHGY